MNNESGNKDHRASFENMGKRVDEEVEKLISYLNDEVVPSVRSHSIKGMRVAADKLSRFADYMEQSESEPAARKSDSDEGTGS